MFCSLFESLKGFLVKWKELSNFENGAGLAFIDCTFNERNFTLAKLIGAELGILTIGVSKVFKDTGIFTRGDFDF